MLLMSPKENQTHIFKVFLIFLKKFSCTTDIFPKGEEEEMGRNLFLCRVNIKSNQQKTKVRDFFCLVAWFGEERWCGGYGCDVLNGNHSRTSTFLVFQDGDGTRGPSLRVGCLTTQASFQAILEAAGTPSERLAVEGPSLRLAGTGGPGSGAQHSGTVSLGSLGPSTGQSVSHRAAGLWPLLGA